MSGLKKIVDSVVTEERDLPVSWISSFGVDIKVAGAYEKDCKKAGIEPSAEKVAELLGNNVVNLRLHMLENGFRYVTIHQKDGREIFDDRRYIGLVSCSCGAIHDSPAVTSATWHLKEKPDLGDGFRLNGTFTTSGAISSSVDKEYSVGNNRINLHYSLKPDFGGDDGELSFGLEVNTLRTITFPEKDVEEDDQIMRTEEITAKYVSVRIWSPRISELDVNDNSLGNCYIIVAYNLVNHRVGLFDQVEFEFDKLGKLKKVVGISQSPNLNSEWNDDAVLAAIKKGQNVQFVYSAENPEVQVLARAVFGKEITDLRHNPKGTLDAIMEAVMIERDINLASVVDFI